MKNFDECGMTVAHVYGKQSTCSRKQVGVAILDKYGHVISTGFNGSPSGCEHCVDVFTPDKIKSPDYMEAHRQWAAINEIHGEANAIITALKLGRSLEGCILYTTLSPCKDCAKLIIAAGIKEVVYDEVYDRDSSPVEWLKAHGVKIRQYSLN